MEGMFNQEEKETKKDSRLEMFCECCESKFKRWEIDMVEPEDCVFEVNQLMKDMGKELVDFNFACPQCVTELVLTPLQTDKAKTFREKNEKLRKVLEPTTIH